MIKWFVVYLLAIVINVVAWSFVVTPLLTCWQYWVSMVMLGLAFVAGRGFEDALSKM